MGDLLIRNLPDTLKDRLATRAKESGRSLSDEAKVRLVRSLAEDTHDRATRRNALEVIRGAFARHDALMTDEEHAEFMREVEEGRRDFGRPIPEFE